MQFFAIIPSAGIGNRFGGSTPKQYVKLKGTEILARTISIFEKSKLISGIVICADLKYFKKIQKIIQKNSFSKVIAIIQGGKSRQESVYNGLNFIDCNDNDIIAVHDAARPNLSISLLGKVLMSACKFGAAIPGYKFSDTIKLADNKGNVKNTIPREFVYAVQTPQAAKYCLLKKSFDEAIKNKFSGTDESAILEYAKVKVKIVDGEMSNIKITSKEDFKKIQKYIK